MARRQHATITVATDARTKGRVYVAAHADGISPSAWVRALILEELARRGLTDENDN